MKLPKKEIIDEVLVFCHCGADISEQTKYMYGTRVANKLRIQVEPCKACTEVEPLRFFIHKKELHGRDRDYEFIANLMDKTGIYVIKILGVYHTEELAKKDCRLKASQIGIPYGFI